MMDPVHVDCTIGVVIHDEVQSINDYINSNYIVLLLSLIVSVTNSVIAIVD